MGSRHGATRDLSVVPGRSRLEEVFNRLRRRLQLGRHDHLLESGGVHGHRPTRIALRRLSRSPRDVRQGSCQQPVRVPVRKRSGARDPDPRCIPASHYAAGNSPLLASCERLASLVMATDERTDRSESQCRTRRFSHQLARTRCRSAAERSEDGAKGTRASNP